MKELLQQALDALTRLSFLGNGDFPGNSEGNRIAQKAVADIKQALSQQEQPAQKPDLWKTQFLTDVMTSAGLLRYGRTDKKLAQRIADGSARWRTELYASAPTQPALTYSDLEACREVAGKTFRHHKSSVKGQQVCEADDYEWHLAKAIEAHCRGGAVK